MIKIIRANQKSVLAGLSIIAMISFVANFGGKGRGEGVSDHKFGTIGGKSVYLSEVSEARAELDALKNHVSFEPTSRNDEEDYYAVAVLEHEKPELFMLLRHEANDLGITVSEDDVERYMRYRTRGLTADDDAYTVTRDGVRDMLKVLARYHVLAQSQKVSQPQVDQLLAKAGETLQIKLVQLKAEDYLDKVPVPKPEEVQAQFDQFANTVPHHPLPTTNPFGFGYKLPQRATAQYLRLTDEAIKTAVIDSKSDYDWDVQAHKYYYTNLSKYLQTPEAPEGPAAPGLSAPTTRPVPKQYLSVKEEILTELRKDPIDALKDQVTSYITTTTTADWQAYSKFIAASPQGVEPPSSLGVPYTSFDYLANLAGSVSAKFNIKLGMNLAVDKTPDLLAQDQYSTWPGFGSPAVTKFVDKQASDYVALLAANDPSAKATLLQPSAALQGPLEHTTLFVRLTAALPSQPPADVSQVRAQVEADLKTAAGYKMAQAQAASLLLAAKSNNLNAAALATGHFVIPADPLPTITAYSADIKALAPPLGDDTADFLKQGFQLLAAYSPSDNQHPAQTIELPDQRRVFVIQLDKVKAGWDDTSYFRDCATIRGEAGFADEQKFFQSWFNKDNTYSRLDYKPLKAE